MTGSLFVHDRLVITGMLIVETPLHVGSGEQEEDKTIPRAKKEDTTHPESSQIQRDGQDRPWIPGSTLKGAMKALAANDMLYGTPHGESGTAHGESGAMGRLTVFGAAMINAPSNSSVPRYAKKGAKGVGLEARTAIDKGRGTAEKHKLYHAERVVPGAKFDFHAELICDGGAGSLDGFGAVLGAMQQGFALGRGKNTGAGRLRLDILSQEMWGLSDDGRWAKKSAKAPLTIAPPQPKGGVKRLRLKCQGPFLVNDSFWADEREKKNDKEPHLKALGVAKGLAPEPLLPGSSLKGVLRARSAWLEALNGPKDITDLLFGTAERAAALRILSVKPVGTPQTWVLPSVKLDRFSGAPFEGGLFTTQCFADPEFEVVLWLDDRLKDVKKNAQAVKDHLKALLKDIKGNGLRLGHGGNRGFGWFTVMEVK